MLAATRVFQFLTGLFRIKLSAVLLGTVGMGIVDQFTFLTNKISHFTTTGTAEGFVKQIASNSQSGKIKEVLDSTIKSYALVITGFALLTSSISLFFRDYLANYIFGDIAYVKYIYLAILTFPLLVLGSVPFSILKAFKNVKIIARARIYIVSSQILIALPMIYFFRLKGAILYITISYIVDLFFMYYFVRKFYFKEYKISIKSVIKAPLITAYLKELFVFSGFGLTVGVYAIISDVTCRAIIVSSLGVEAIGVYSPIILFASLFTGFILPSLSTYLYPRFCELKENSQISNVINNALRMATLVLIPFLFIGIPFQKILIKIFFSADFIEASNYLPYHFFGVMFFVWMYIFSQSFTPTGRIAIHGIFRIIHFTIDILITYFTVKYYGLYGWMIKYIASSFIFFFVYSTYSRKKMDFTFNIKNLKLMLFLLASTMSIIALQAFVDLDIYTIVLGFILLFLSYLFLDQEERKLLGKIKNKIL